jgi:hypothetical protein
MIILLFVAIYFLTVTLKSSKIIVAFCHIMNGIKLFHTMHLKTVFFTRIKQKFGGRSGATLSDREAGYLFERCWKK